MLHKGSVKIPSFMWRKSLKIAAAPVVSDRKNYLQFKLRQVNPGSTTGGSLRKTYGFYHTFEHESCQLNCRQTQAFYANKFPCSGNR